MKNVRLIIHIGVFFVLSAPSLLAQSTEQLFLKKLQESNSATQSIQSNFVQTQQLAIMEEPLISSGIFYYKKPGLMKWDQQLPSPYYFIINGETVTKFDGKKRKIMSANSPQFAYFKEFILGTISGDMFTSKKFATTYVQKEEVILIELRPLQKTMLKRIEKINMVFEFETSSLKELMITEVGGDKMEIVFSHHQINTITDNTIFE